MQYLTEPGVYDLPDADYHADPCPTPSLSSSVAKLLLRQSPRHAWTAHPRLNPAFKADDRKAFDVGTATHALFLRKAQDVRVINADSFRTKEAKAARDEAYAAGLTPLLTDQWDAVSGMLAAIPPQLEAHREAVGAFVDGYPERTLVWQEDGIWFRAKPDWAAADWSMIYDLKTTTTAEPDAWSRRMFDLGHDFSAAFYRRGVRALGLHADPVMRLCVVENSPPHALSIIQPEPAVMQIADKQVAAAIDLWRECLTMDRWPGYPAVVCHVGLPAWREQQWLDREVREDARDGPISDVLLNWWNPNMTTRTDG